MSSINSQLGVKVESTYGTAVVVDRFYQFNSMGVDYEHVRLRSEGLRSSGYAPLASQQRIAVQGAKVPVEMEWMTKGMGWWLPQMLGYGTTTGPTDSAYTHTGTLGALYGDYFTMQGNFPLNPAGTDQAITFAGCKVTDWELSCDVDGLMMFKPSVDARAVATGTALASASYPSGMVPYGWIDVAATIAGTAVAVKSWTVKCDSQLKADRYKQQASALKQEPTEDGQRKITWEAEIDFDSLTQHNRVRATVDANASVALVFTASCADSGVLIGASTPPSTTITMPKASFDKFDGLEMKGPDGPGISAKISGDVLWDGSNSPVTIAYVSADSTA